MLSKNEKKQDVIEVTDFTVLETKNEEKEEQEIEEMKEEIEEKENQKAEIQKEEKKKESLIGTIFNRVLLLISLFLIFASIFLVQFCVVSGDSMVPTLDDGDVVLIEKVTKEYERMDVVVIKNNGRYLIKRVIGLPGEEIKIENGKVFVNGKEIEDVAEEETERAGIAEKGILLGDNEYFLLGDNREESVDSRDSVIGVVKEENIVGKSVFFFSFFK